VTDETKKTLAEEHIDRCIECYGMVDATNFAEPVDRGTHEQMRADLMIAIGMLSALLPRKPEPTP
jgi:hypothetical protein